MIYSFTTTKLPENQFNYLVDDLMQISPSNTLSIDTSPTNTVETKHFDFPSQSDSIKQNRKAYLQYYEDSASEQEESNGKIEDTTSGKFIYTVRKGWRTEIYSKWSQTKAAVSKLSR